MYLKGHLPDVEPQAAARNPYGYYMCTLGTQVYTMGMPDPLLAFPAPAGISIMLVKICPSSVGNGLA
jgi:hypothetical protein